MVGWHHWLSGCEFEQALGVGDRHGSLACCTPWGRKEFHTTEWLNWTELICRQVPLSRSSSCSDLLHRQPCGTQASLPALLSSIYIKMVTPDCPTPSKQSKRLLQPLCFNAQSFSRVRLSATPRTVPCQTPLSLGFPRQEHFMGFHVLLQGILLTQGSNPCLLHFLN